MTRGEMRTRVAARLDDDASPTYSAAEIHAAINEGLTLFAFYSLCLEKTVSFALSTTTHTPLSVLPDYLAALRVSVGGVRVRPVRLADLDALDQSWRAATASAPLRYAALGCNLLVQFPAAAATVDITYAYAAPLLALDSDVPAIPALYHPVLIDYATYRVLAGQGGAMLQKALGYLRPWADAVASAATLTRLRGLLLGYDTLPPELQALAAKKETPKK